MVFLLHPSRSSSFLLTLLPNNEYFPNYPILFKFSITFGLIYFSISQWLCSQSSSDSFNSLTDLWRSGSRSGSNNFLASPDSFTSAFFYQNHHRSSWPHWTPLLQRCYQKNHWSRGNPSPYLLLYLIIP